MNDTVALLTLAGVWLAAVVTPGPDFLAIVHAAVTRSRAAGLQVVLGVLLGMTCWSLAALSGLGLLFAYWPWLYAAIKTAGAVYLLVLGVRLIIGRGASPPQPPGNGAAEGPAKRSAPSLPFARGVRRGLFTNLGNPKALALFGSLLAVLLPAGGPLWLQGAALAILLGIPSLWYPLVVLAFSHHRVQRAYGRIRHGLDRLTGGIFLYLGIRLTTAGE